MLDADTIVVGSGAGGLTAALCLAQAGERVLVFEQHDVPGGWRHSFRLGGYRFSPGVHYLGELGPGQMLRSIYEGLGVASDLTFFEMNPDGFEHFRVGDEVFDLPSGKEAKDTFHDKTSVPGSLCPGSLFFAPTTALSPSIILSRWYTVFSHL